jgi:hypothetical protein
MTETDDEFLARAKDRQFMDAEDYRRLLALARRGLTSGILEQALKDIAAPAPTAEEMNVEPGFHYWCAVAARRQDRAYDALRALKDKKP